MSNTSAEEFDKIPRRPYWDDEARERLKSARHLTLDVEPNVSWSFPLAQLIWFKWSVYQSGNPEKSRGDQNAIVAGVLILRFHNATVTVQTRYPEQFVRTILSGQTNVLVRRIMKRESSSGTPQIFYSDKNPESSDFDSHYGFTGPIEVKENHANE